MKNLRKSLPIIFWAALTTLLWMSCGESQSSAEQNPPATETPEKGTKTRRYVPFTEVIDLSVKQDFQRFTSALDGSRGGLERSGQFYERTVARASNFNEWMAKCCDTLPNSPCDEYPVLKTLLCADGQNGGQGCGQVSNELGDGCVWCVCDDCNDCLCCDDEADDDGGMADEGEPDDSALESTARSVAIANGKQERRIFYSILAPVGSKFSVTTFEGKSLPIQVRKKTMKDNNAFAIYTLRDQSDYEGLVMLSADFGEAGQASLQFNHAKK